MRYVQEFLTARKLDGLAPGTLEQYEMELRYLPPFLGKPTIEATKTDLRAYLAQYKDMAERTYMRKVSILKAFYTWTTYEANIPNPMQNIKVPKEPTSMIKYLEDKEFEKFRYVKRSLRNRAIIELLVSSGMRVSELVSVNIDDLDMENNEIKITGKGNKQRIVHFNTIAKDKLLEYLDTRKDKNPALFINKYGNRISIRAIEQQIKREAKLAGLRIEATPHTLRHTFATHLIQRGADIIFIAEEMGHESVSTTQKYAKLNLKARREMYKKFMAI
ncbi:site-specific tyrosine recombinase/integron integrase [Desulfosporosinus sp.]|uniref:site-specific tyrosine recombinase/integron integrase n=1 Tax=Desulfosporosinus sp. TaxID=157907 RepID=UPI0025C290B7|nr:site-specific tyrosine recombinase/integron integrase [Desulfosporosinus sp.]MBC2723318.1 tyrosine-type recombinase/integrase [Desulfosporosinus sp.]MBC2726244.1 tyrosine-type recombinase/integrase [Desulfosporosinus sp.]